MNDETLKHVCSGLIFFFKTVQIRLNIFSHYMLKQMLPRYDRLGTVVTISSFLWTDYMQTKKGKSFQSTIKLLVVDRNAHVYAKTSQLMF